MATNTNIGQQSALTVYGNPESFKKLIYNHGQLCKVKQALVCPCAAENSGTPNIYTTGDVVFMNGATSGTINHSTILFYVDNSWFFKQ